MKAEFARALRRGDPFVWFTGSALGISLVMVFGLIAVILVNGLGFFWPRPLELLTLNDGSQWLGERTGREVIPRLDARDPSAGHRANTGP
jgi:phosphate transport system permease protein